MIIVAAMTGDRVIGKRGRLPWNIPEEYQHFLSLIRGATVIMGRRSYEAFGDDCTCRHLVVVSRSLSRLSGATVCHSIDEAIRVANDLGQPIYIAGGSTVYAQTIDLVSDLYLSYIYKSYAGDSLFPVFDQSQWNVVRREPHKEFEFVVYARRATGGSSPAEGGAPEHTPHQTR